MRLIDADKYKEEIMLIMQCWNISPILSPSEADEAKRNLRTALNVLSDMPTAYDIDKVIQKITELQLEVQEKFYNVEDEEYAIMLRGRLRGISDCLEIVKSGGVSNDQI